MMKQLHFRVLAMVLVYGLLKFFGGPFGQMALYPVTLLVTFLHELGHALAALLSGGQVEGLHISADGSGFTSTRGGSPGFILIGGYLGSAVLGNLLFYLGARHKALTDIALQVLAVVMALVGLVWFESFVSTALLFGFAALLWLAVRYTDWDQDILMFLGLTAVLYIIQDFRVGPSSDLARYEAEVGLFPARIWMFIWLGLALLLFFWNLRQIFGRRFFR